MCDRLGMPTEYSIRLDDCRNGFESLSSELFPDFSKLSPFSVFESKLAFYFRSQNTVFAEKIFISKPKFLVDGAGDVSEQFLPRHAGSPELVKMEKTRTRLADGSKINDSRRSATTPLTMW